MSTDTDRELLEAAARAAGHKVYAARQAERDEAGHGAVGLWLANGCTCWNPLTDDADSARLRRALCIVVQWFPTDVAAMHWGAEGRGRSWAEPYGDDLAAAERRAVVRAAAAIAQEPPCPKT